MLNHTNVLDRPASSTTYRARHSHRQCSLVHKCSSCSTAAPRTNRAGSASTSRLANSSCFYGASRSSSSRHFNRVVPQAATAADSPSAASDSSSGSTDDALDDAAEVEASFSMSDEPGPAFRDTLAMLEWHRLCEHLAKHSSTTIGKKLCLQLSVPLQEATSLRLQQEVRSVLSLEDTYMSLLDFGGINSTDAEAAIKRATKGGMVAAKQLRGLVTLLEGADRLKRQIALVARQNRITGRDSPLRPLLDATGGVVVPRGLMGAITAAIQEDGELGDNASEQVRTTRARVRGLTARITNMLKGYPGEPSEKGGRICIAAPAGTKINNGVLLGTSVGGGMVFIEPGQVVSLNNELMSARAEALSAEEAVLWDLSARLMGVLDDVQLAFDTVGWLDLTAAKVRFGLWLGGVLPSFTPWEDVFDRRPAGAPFGTTLPHTTGGLGPAVSLQGLSHPLLLADYKAKRQNLEHQAAMTATAAANSGRKGAGRLLPTRKEVMARRMSGPDAAALLSGQVPSDQQQQQEGGSALSPADQLAQLRAPTPINISIQPETAVVVITGPNTGGKTATMKALGLAACMAKTGMMLPATAPARLPCFSSVLADIGDEQSLTANLSTFSGHIKRISAVRGEADGWSLLLLDELGTGTDPTEGAALGQALLKTLVRGGPCNGALTIATTHHSIMTGLKFDDGRVENASVEFDEEKLAPTYKLLWGVPGRSNALNIASRLGLDPSIIDAARRRLAVGVSAANEAIEELEGAQGELQQADVALFAVEGVKQDTKERVLQAKELNLQKQQELAFKRIAAIQQVLEGARPLLKALKLERKARMKGNGQTKVTRELDAALGEPAIKDAAKKVETALEAFNTLTGNTNSSSSSRATANAYSASAADASWFHTWAQLLREARATLAGSLLRGDGDSSSSGSSADDAAEELEGELAALRAKAAAAAAAKEAEVQAAQQLLDETFQQLQQKLQGQGQTAAAAAGGDGEDQGEAAAGQQQQVGRKAKSIEEELAEERVIEGIRLIEEALDQDTDLWDTMHQQQAALEAQVQAEEQRQRQQAAEQLAELAELERQFEEDIDELQLAWHTAAAEAADAAAREEQERQQAAAAAAEAERQHQEQQRRAAEEKSRQQREAEMQLFKAFEELTDLDDLGALEDFGLTASVSQPQPPSFSSSSSRSSNRPSSSSRQQAFSSSSRSASSRTSSSASKQVSPSPAAAPPAAAPAAGGGAAGGQDMLDLLLEELDGLTTPAPLKQQQQQQPQLFPGGSKQKHNKAKPVIKFRKG